MRVNIAVVGLYHPGNSLLHRCPAGAKLITLLLFLIISSFWAKTLIPSFVAMALVALGYVIGRIPFTLALRQYLTPLPVLVLLGVLLWWRTTPENALATTLMLWAAVTAALLLSLTTRVSALLTTFEWLLHPLGKLGVPVESISLAISLTMRAVPLQLQALQEVMEARQARGAGFSLTAFGVPLIVKSLLRARAIGDALIARGVGDAAEEDGTRP